MQPDYKGLYTFVTEQLLEQLPRGLKYHSKEHTLDVLAVCEDYVMLEGLDADQALVLKTSALLHDAGFIRGTMDHEMHGSTLAGEILPLYGYSDRHIVEIQNLILATKVPQQPETYLEEILCDADLDYLGRDDFEAIGDRLFEELKIRGVLTRREEWDDLQIRFLTAHTFHTQFARNEREPVKQAHLATLIRKRGE